MAGSRSGILDLARTLSRTSEAVKYEWGNRDGPCHGARNRTWDQSDYMSPEQARGEVVDVPVRSVLVWLGPRACDQQTGFSTKSSTVETLAAIVREEPAPIERDIPAPLRWIIDRCLIKGTGGAVRIDPRPLARNFAHCATICPMRTAVPNYRQRPVLGGQGAILERWRATALVGHCGVSCSP